MYIYSERVCAYDVIAPIYVLLLLLLLPLLTYAHNIVPLGQQWQYKLPVPIAIYIYTIYIYIDIMHNYVKYVYT